METCRICQQKNTEEQEFCSNCGYPLTMFPSILEEISPFQEILSQRERWEKEIWQKYEQLQQQYAELSHNFQQLQQQFDKQQQEASNNQQLQPQIDQLKQENARLQGQIESYSQFQQSQQQLIEQLRNIQESRQSQENSQPYQQLQQQVGQLQQEIANLRQENAKLQQKSEPQSSSQQQREVPLESAVGYDYTRLRDLLANQKWQEADEETAKAMLQVAGKERRKLRIEDIDNFPCEDLRTIDRLWVKYSNGKLGLSVQKEIYQSLGGTRSYNPEIWEKFGDTVGWREHGEWKKYSDHIRKTTAPNIPTGHLPSFGIILAGTQSVFGCHHYLIKKTLTLLSRRDL